MTLTADQGDEIIRIIDREFDIEVDRDGLCHWADVANAMTHIKAQVRALSALQSDGWLTDIENAPRLNRTRPYCR